MVKGEYTLIITEKPNASKRIAAALADRTPVQKKVGQVSYYEITHEGKPYVVACAVGHLYGLKEKEKTKNFKYPVFDIEWAPTSEVSKSSAFSKKYLTVLKKVAKGAKGFIVATDFDIEGEVIGLNCLRYACKQKDAKRMKFSTLTKGDLQESFNQLRPTLEWGMANAGECRHKLDWFYGINLSRALSSSILKSGMFKILSSGRVQGPALKMVVDKEREIQAFKPVPYWQIEMTTKKVKETIESWHEADKFWDVKEADTVMEKTKGAKTATVKDLTKSQKKQQPPHPFDLTSLQTEAYRCLRVSPKQTASIAQDLYSNGFISYPRTSSQQLPEQIGFKKILNLLAKNEMYKELTAAVLKTPLKPNNGKKTDPAHPAIYPTGMIPTGLDKKAAGIYDLIVKRFCATFGPHAVRESNKIIFDVNGELFNAKGIRTIEEGWYAFYRPYVRIEESELPKLEKGEEVNIEKIQKHDKETQPPKRYTDASIIKDLEKRNLGTKATRANILETLRQRNYIEGKQIQATDLGIKIVGILEKHCPRILDEALTRHFEEEMEKIQEKKKNQDGVLDEAEKVLQGILTDFKKHEKEIGEGLQGAFKETRTQQSTVGKCPQCDEGVLMMRRGKFGRFIACDKYPDCKTTYSLPNTGLIKPTDKVCEHCSLPIVQVIRKAKRPQEVCIGKECESKKSDADSESKFDDEGKTCPKCEKGTLVKRTSLYGSFLACNAFPKCRYIPGNKWQKSTKKATKKSTKKKATKKKARKKTKRKKTAKRTSKKKP